MNIGRFLRPEATALSEGFQLEDICHDFRNGEVMNPARKAELEKLAATLEEDDNHLLIAITPKK